MTFENTNRSEFFIEVVNLSIFLTRKMLVALIFNFLNFIVWLNFTQINFKLISTAY